MVGAGFHFDDLLFELILAKVGRGVQVVADMVVGEDDGGLSILGDVGLRVYRGA